MCNVVGIAAWKVIFFNFILPTSSVGQEGYLWVLIENILSCSGSLKYTIKTKFKIVFLSPDRVEFNNI
jgi:hypothetical protein